MSPLPFAVQAIDHVVIACRDVEASVAWYRDKLGLVPLRLDEWRAGEVPFVSLRISPTALIDLEEGEPTGVNVPHFSLCVSGPLDHVSPENGYEVVRDPRPIFGARGIGPGMYVRDPDGNVVELKTYG